MRAALCGCVADTTVTTQPAPKKKAAADVYDYEDEWIDDTELIEYFGGDQRRAKHKGFFINKGDIEREDGPAKTSPLVRKRRRKDDEGPEKQGEEANTEAPTPMQRKVGCVCVCICNGRRCCHRHPGALTQKKPKKAAAVVEQPAVAQPSAQQDTEAATQQRPPADAQTSKPPSGRENAPPATPQRASVPPQGAPQPTPKALSHPAQGATLLERVRCTRFPCRRIATPRHACLQARVTMRCLQTWWRCSSACAAWQPSTRRPRTTRPNASSLQTSRRCCHSWSTCTHGAVALCGCVRLRCGVVVDI